MAPNNAKRGAAVNRDDNKVDPISASNTHDVVLSGNVNDPRINDCRVMIKKKIIPEKVTMLCLIINGLIPNSGKNEIEVNTTKTIKLINNDFESYFLVTQKNPCDNFSRTFLIIFLNIYRIVYSALSDL
jgi:hypothetical protein